MNTAYININKMTDPMFITTMGGRPHCTFDAEMTEVVRSFQAAQGLPVTGEIDAATWSAIEVPGWAIHGADVNGDMIIDASEFDGISTIGCRYLDTPENAPVLDEIEGTDCSLTDDADSSRLFCSGGGVIISSNCHMVGDTVSCSSNVND